MQLSKNFTLDELTFSQTATRSGLDNTPDEATLSNLKYTAEQLEVVRKILEYPIFISSGYRSPELNKLIGGSLNSDHQFGKATDFTCPKFGTPEKIVKKLLLYDIPYKQLILEYGRWVHISFSKEEKPKKQVLVIDLSGTRIFS